MTSGAASALSIDIGSAYTTAATAGDGPVRVLDLERNGEMRMPSAVWMDDDGRFLIGTAAQSGAPTAPERYQPSVLSVAGTGPVLLGERLLPVTALFVPLLRHVAALAQEGGSGVAPRELRIAYSPDWGETRRTVLTEAAKRAGFEQVQLVAAPIAAALQAGGTRWPAGSHVAVYDLGETFAATVLRRTRQGFEQVVAPSTSAVLGGGAVDRSVMAHLGSGPAAKHADWSKLLDPPDARWRQRSARLRADVRRAKERLSSSIVTTLQLPGTDQEVQLTRGELEELVRPVLESSLRLFRDTVARAGLSITDLSEVLLVGGCCRMPLVAETVWRGLGPRPTVDDHPEATAALGCLIGHSVERLRSSRRFHPRLSAATVTSLWSHGSVAYGYVAIEGDGVRVQASDEPARGKDVEELSRQAADRWRQQRRGFTEREVVPSPVFDVQNGLERRFRIIDGNGEQAYFERYAHAADRWFTVTAPEHARDIAERVVLEPASGEAVAGGHYELRIAADLPEGWTASERIELVRSVTWHRVTAESFPLAEPMTNDQWASWRAEPFQSHPELAPVGRGTGRFLGGHESVILTFRSTTGDGTLTRLWLGVVDGRGYSVIASLPERDKLGLPLLAKHMALR
jgi:hypothetical protein